MRIILASSSPRRREIMNLLNVEYEAISPKDEEHFEETLTPEENTILTAKRKAKWVYESLQSKEDTVVIGVDTVVVADSEILQKPVDENDLMRMIQLYRGSSHKVLSGMCVMSKNHISESVSETKVFIKNISDEEISAYNRTGEGFDKAGGYGIQGAFSKFVTKIEGNYFNVMGLDISSLYDILKNQFGVKMF